MFGVEWITERAIGDLVRGGKTITHVLATHRPFGALIGELGEYKRPAGACEHKPEHKEGHRREMKSLVSHLCRNHTQWQESGKGGELFDDRIARLDDSIE